MSDLVEQLNQFVRLQLMPTVRHTQRRQRVLLAWVVVLTVVSVASLGVAVATLVEVIR
jgi:hypothetical protein